MKTLFFIKKKKITADAQVLRALLEEKAAKIQARSVKEVTETVCRDLVHLQTDTHAEACFAEQEVFFGKRLAAAFGGLTASELFKPAYPNERRNRANRNKLTPEEEEILHQTRLAIRKLQLN